MRKRTQNAGKTVERYGKYMDVAARYSIGRNTAIKLAKEAKAVIKIGKTVICDFSLIDLYLDEQRRKQLIKKE